MLQRMHYCSFQCTVVPIIVNYIDDYLRPLSSSTLSSFNGKLHLQQMQNDGVEIMEQSRHGN